MFTEMGFQYLTIKYQNSVPALFDPNKPYTSLYMMGSVVFGFEIISDNLIKFVMNHVADPPACEYYGELRKTE